MYLGVCGVGDGWVAEWEGGCRHKNCIYLGRPPILILRIILYQPMKLRFKFSVLEC